MTRVQLVDPSAFTPPYDHALATALAGAGASVELVTSRFAYGDVPRPDGYAQRELFYRRAVGAPGSALRRASKLAAHIPDMLALRRHAATADVVHFQWLDVPWLDHALLPRGPTVLTAHDLLPREPWPGQAAAQRRLLQRVDAVITHSEYGRGVLVSELGLDPGAVHVVPHGAFTHLGGTAPLPSELEGGEGPVVLFFGLLRPYKGLDVLVRAWREVTGARLWIVGRPMQDLAPLRALAGPSVRFLPGFVPDAALPAIFRAADLVVLPYTATTRFDQSGVLATALGFGTPVLASAVGGFPELAETGAVRLVTPGDAGALAGALSELVADPEARAQLAARAREAAAGPYSWRAAAEQTLELYRSLGR